MINSEFKRVLTEAVGEDNALTVINSFDTKPSVSIRFNHNKFEHLRQSNQSFDVNSLFGESPAPIEWSKNAYFLEQRPVFTLDPLYHAGLYYPQDSSSMFVTHRFRSLLESYKNSSDNVRILDLCAAPGGKSTDILSHCRELLGDRFILLSNEVIKSRASLLAENIARWGDANVLITNTDAKTFQQYPSTFDIILADLPCSGEGMFRKNEKAQQEWSLANVELCRLRQRRIIADVWPSLKEGAYLIYSTCTFNKMENDDNVAWILENLGAEIVLSSHSYKDVISTEYGDLLLPGFVAGEGQYCAILRKTSSSNPAAMSNPADIKYKKPVSLTIKKEESQLLSRYLIGDYVFVEKSDLYLAIPEKIYADYQYFSNLHPIYSGLAIASMKAKEIIPYADLALSQALNYSAFPILELSKDMALRFLKREALPISTPHKGINLVSYNNMPLGFVKNIGSRCNNLLPQLRKIRMDINN